MRLFAFFAVVFALACGAFLYSRTIPYSKDEIAFRTAKSKLEHDYYTTLEHTDRLPDHFDASFDTAYNKLLAEHLTPRNAIKKYSLTISVLAAGMMMLFCRGIQGLKTPPNKWLILPVGFIAVALTCWGMLQDSQEEYGRGEHPIWYDDSPGFAVGFFVITFILSLWVALHAIFVAGRDLNKQAAIFGRHLKYSNAFLVAELIITFLLIGWAFWEGGSYFSLTATPFWLYFYASILAVRAKTHERLKSTDASA